MPIPVCNTCRIWLYIVPAPVWDDLTHVGLYREESSCLSAKHYRYRIIVLPFQHNVAKLPLLEH
jgi:hypothetical protein